jgi:hypothetical protein
MMSLSLFMLLLRFVMRRLIFGMLACCGLLLFWLLVLQLLILLLLCHQPLLRLLRLLLVVRVLVFTVITVAEMDMWRPFATGRITLRRLKIAILHRVLVVLVLEDLRGVLLVQRHRSYSCCFIALWPLRRQVLLVL